MHKKMHTKTIITFSIILLILTFLTGLPLPTVSAEVSIDQLSPTEGPVGTVVLVSGQISTENGSYRIFFDDEEVKNGNANLNFVSNTFVVPNSTYGSHSVKLQDVNTGENSSTSFTVKTDYTVKAIIPTPPKQKQEGGKITIRAITTGGNATTSATITVKDPSDVTHTSNISILINQDGYGEANIAYPTSFDANPHTFYVGTYNVSLNAFNETLATEDFTVGLTDATEYHRFQTVNIKALNYTSTDILKITITYDDETIFESVPRNASEPDGIISANWTIPANTSIGLYTVNVMNTTTLMGSEKPIRDNQTFIIASKSFACEVKTFNLDNQPVEGISVEANNTVSYSVTYGITNKDGIALLNLEASNYTFAAFLDDSQVGAITEKSLAKNLTKTFALNISCALAHIKVEVKDEGGLVLPFVDVSANFTHTSRANATITRTASAETSLTGVATLRNLFTNINYTVKVSRFDQEFDTTTLNLTSTRWFNTTCPTLELIVKIFDRNGSPLQYAQVNITDWGVGATSDSIGTGSSGTSGEVVFNFTFGRYVVKVYKDGVLLNETNTLLKEQPTEFEVHCKLFNVTLGISVLDYFGQGIAKANVTLEREGARISTKHTGSDGVVQFTELVGGDYKIFVYIAEKPFRITVLPLQEPETVTLKIVEIVSIGGLITETSYFVTGVFLLLLIVVFLTTFLYREFRAK